MARWQPGQLSGQCRPMQLFLPVMMGTCNPSVTGEGRRGLPVAFSYYLCFISRTFTSALIFVYPRTKRKTRNQARNQKENQNFRMCFSSATHVALAEFHLFKWLPVGTARAESWQDILGNLVLTSSHQAKRNGKSNSILRFAHKSRACYTLPCFQAIARAVMSACIILPYFIYLHNSCLCFRIHLRHSLLQDVFPDSPEGLHTFPWLTTTNCPVTAYFSFCIGY